MKNSGKIIVLAYPDTFVTHSNEWVCKLLPLLGLGTRSYIKAGHAALILVHYETGKMQYFDFGRYVTPDGYGRVRGENTDAEVALTIRAEIGHDGAIENLNDVLVWLDAHPQKTHGEGRLLASVCDHIDFEKALNFVQRLQDKGSVPYGAFEKNGSNCARFVTDTILAATSEQKIIRALKFNKKFTPSTVGNVEKASITNAVYQVINGNVALFHGSALKENLTNYFSRKKNSASNWTSLNDSRIPKFAHKLSGIGSSAWFLLTSETGLETNHFRIRRYNDLQQLDFDGVYASEVFDPKEPFQFTYDSHCAHCHVIQHSKKIKLVMVGTYAAVNLSQKVHSA